MLPITSALVTGGTGFLGGHLCRRLLAEGVAVRTTVRRTGPAVEALEALNVAICQCGLDDREALRKAADGVGVVFHVAALASYVAPSVQMEAANILGTRNILAAARAAGVRRLVHVSSESVTLTNADRIDEDETKPFPKRFLDHYSRTKAQAEREVLSANNEGIETVAVRPPWIWGERDTSVFKAIALSVQSNRFAFVGDGTNQITTCNVNNICSGLIAAAESPRAPGRVYHLADDCRPTMRDFLSRLCNASGLELPKRQVPYHVAYPAAALSDLLRAMGMKAPIMLSRPYIIHLGRTWILNDRRAREELGYRPTVSMDEGFRRLAAWIKDSKGLNAALGRTTRPYV